LTAREDELRRLVRGRADPTDGGTVLTGPAGVGKTRLAEAALAAGNGPVVRAAGHPSTRDIPLGALSHLLPPLLGDHVGGDELRAELFHQGRAALGRLAADGRLSLLVDDIDQLDDTSLGLLLPLTVDGTLHLIATLRTGRVLPDAIASLVKEGHLTVETVGPLDRSAVVSLLEQVVGMPVEPATADRLVGVSEGNLQVLVELVQAAHAHGEVRVVDGEWSVARLPRSGALQELVGAHLSELTDDQVAATELLAVAGRLPLEDVEAEIAPALLEGLERDGVVRIRDGDGQTVVELAHPVYGEVIRQRLPRLRTRAIQGRLADRLQQRGPDRHDDIVRLAWWRVESGGAIDHELLIQAGRRAIAGRDHQLATRFATEASQRGATHEAARLAVEAAVLAADLDAVEAAVAAVWDDPELPDTTRADLARRLSMIRFASGDLEGALAVIEDGCDRLHDRTTVVGMDVQRAQILANSGHPVEAAVLLESVPQVDDPRVQIERAAAESVAWTSVGRFAEGLDAARRGAAAQRLLPEWLGRRGMATHLVNEAHALSYGGRFAEADELVLGALAEAERSRAPAATFWFHLVAGENSRDRGDGTTALRHFRAAEALTRSAGQRSTMIWVLVGVAQSHLLLGEVDAAAQALDRADAAGDSPVATSWATRERTRAWLYAARGEEDRAAELTRRVVTAVRADGIGVFEAVLLHDLVRLGHADETVELLDVLAQRVEGTYVDAMATHALAAATADVATYRSAADGFAGTGALLFAAETRSELAELLERRGDARAAAAARREVDELVRQLGGAATPTLRRGARPDGLTRREREIAALAASGLRSGEIAERLHLSVRTVDTHLGRVYRKLGIEGRDELPTSG
jgi:DNA-binding CsgD family transcriptional regulator